MQGRAERAIRGSLMGAIAVVLAASSHALAGGPVPGWLGIAVALVLASVLGTVLVARRPSHPRTALLVAASQAAFHYLFAGLGSPGVSLAAHVHGATGPLAAAGHPGHAAHPSMVLAHAVAAVITLVLLRRAEDAVWRMLRELVRAVRAAFGAIATPTARVARPRAALDLHVRPLVGRVRSTAPLRGPPALLA